MKIKVVAYGLILLPFLAKGQIYDMCPCGLACADNFPCPGPATFRDPGGAANYTNNCDAYHTFFPDAAGSCMSVSFSSFNLQNGFDFLHIYDANGTSNPFPGSPFTGTTSPGTLTASTDAITFHFLSNGSTVAAGWVSTISCVPCGGLPLELLNFTGTPFSTGIELKWATASETNNNYFTVERSTDGITWEIAGIVRGAGNSAATRNYEFVDLSTVSFGEGELWA